MAEDSKSYGLAWFLAGLGVGALVGILYAPKSGRETREDIVSGAKEGTEYLKRPHPAGRGRGQRSGRQEQGTGHGVRGTRPRGRGSRPCAVGRVCGAGQEHGRRTDRKGELGGGCRTPGLPLDDQSSRRARVLTHDLYPGGIFRLQWAGRAGARASFSIPAGAGCASGDARELRTLCRRRVSPLHSESVFHRAGARPRMRGRGTNYDATPRQLRPFSSSLLPQSR